MEVGMGFFGSRTLLTAVELELFTHLRAGKLTGDAIAQRLRLHPRAIPDFPDALVALGVLDREGDGPDALYGNTTESAAFLDKKSPQYIGGILEMASTRLYHFWGSLTEALQTGQPQNEIKDSGEPLFAKLYAAPERRWRKSSISRGTRRFVTPGAPRGSWRAWWLQRTHTCGASLRTFPQLNQLPSGASSRWVCPTA
jgi:hypothetical protein